MIRSCTPKNVHSVRVTCTVTTCLVKNLTYIIPSEGLISCFVAKVYMSCVDGGIRTLTIGQKLCRKSCSTIKMSSTYVCTSMHD